MPYLCNYEGWAIFLDCDEMFTVDPKELWDLRDDRYSVMVRKHVHRPEEERKFLNQEQTRYKYKNWSSLMLFNNEKCRALTPDYVKLTPGLELHQFKWLGNDAKIGDLPTDWNHLVEINYSDTLPKLLHWTKGGPYFNEFRYCPYSKEWFDMYEKMTHCDQR